jgi:hypothetical protein
MITNAKFTTSPVSASKLEKEIRRLFRTLKHKWEFIDIHHGNENTYIRYKPLGTLDVSLHTVISASTIHESVNASIEPNTDIITIWYKRQLV